MKKTLCSLGALACGIMSYAQIEISHLGRYTDGRYEALEICTYDSLTKSIWVTNAATDSIDFLDASDITNPVYTGGFDITPYGGSVTSVISLKNGMMAAAVVAFEKTDSGSVLIISSEGELIKQLKVGFLPDMVTITSDAGKLLVACEGEPNDDYTIDPKGSVAIIDLSSGIESLSQSDVTILEFDDAPEEITGSIHKPGTSWAVDLEPEYIAVSEDNKTAMVACQEANVLIKINLETNTIEAYYGLGFKDHSIEGNGLDVSDKDDAVNILTWPVKGIYMPDAMVSFTQEGINYYVSANEGDGRDYDGYSSETRVKDLDLDPAVFSDPDIQEDENLGRLKTLTMDVVGDTDGDGLVDEIYAYGARSFSIWDEEGNLVFDSGDEFEQYIAAHHASYFNCDEGLAEEMDNRSDDKGPEPEAITIGKVGDRTYAFIGLERQSGIFVYDITNPAASYLDTFIHTYQGDTAVDVGPEGIYFIPAAHNHTDKNLLLISHEISGTVSIYEIEDKSLGILNPQSGMFPVSVYPNPGSDQLHISLPGTLQKASIHITNVLGQKVAETFEEMMPAKTTLDISHLQDGVYWINVQSPELQKPIHLQFVKK